MSEDSLIQKVIDQHFTEMFTVLSQAVCTPSEGYKRDGGLVGVVRDAQSLVENYNRVKAFVEDIRDGWDCDEDAHKYGTPCRCCEAEQLLKSVSIRKGGSDDDGTKTT